MNTNPLNYNHQQQTDHFEYDLLQCCCIHLQKQYHIHRESKCFRYLEISILHEVAASYLLLTTKLLQTLLTRLHLF